MGSIICSNCFKGYVVPSKPPINMSNWHCEHCSHKFQGKLINSTISEGWLLIEETDSTDLKKLESLLNECLKTFPPTSNIIIEIKQKIIACLRDIIMREPSISKVVLKRKIELCKDLLKVVEIIEPGISRLKGIIVGKTKKKKI